jgi:hypothetical protein
MDAVPPFTAVTVAALLDPVAATVAAAVDDEPQFRVGWIACPAESSTSAVSPWVPGGVRENVVPEPLELCTRMLVTGQVVYAEPVPFTPDTLAKSDVAPGVCAVMTPLVSAVCMVAVPLQVAVPLLNVACTGGVAAPYPGVVIVNCVPLAIVFLLVRGTVAVAPITPLKLLKLQVWPLEPVMVPPER